MAYIGLDDKLGMEVMKCYGLEKELGTVKASLLKESDEHDSLRVAVQLVFDDLELALEQEMSLYEFRAIQIMDQVHEIMRDVLCFGVHRSFVIARSHYENINLAMMSQGFVPIYSNTELEDIENEVAPLAQDLSTKIEDEIIPQRIS